MSNRACWLSIGLLAGLLTLMLSWPVWAQETQKATFCDTQDEITAVALYGEAAVPIINRTFKQACNSMLVTFLKGNPVETVRDPYNKLWDIVPVIVYAAGHDQRPVTPLNQWVYTASPLVSVSNFNYEKSYLKLVTWNGAKTDSSAWYEHQELTPETQARLKVQWKSCCANSDVFKTQFRVSSTTNGDEWWYLKNDTWFQVPPDTIHWGEHAPSGEATMFVDTWNVQPMGTVLCFFPPLEGG